MTMRKWVAGRIESGLRFNPAGATIERSGVAVVIGWPAEFSGFQLEETDRLPATTWAPVSGVVNNRVTVDVGTGERFFRLRKQ